MKLNKRSTFQNTNKLSMFIGVSFSPISGILSYLPLDMNIYRILPEDISRTTLKSMVESYLKYQIPDSVLNVSSCPLVVLRNIKPHDLKSKVYFILGFNTTLDKVHHLYTVNGSNSLDAAITDARTFY